MRHVTLVYWARHNHVPHNLPEEWVGRIEGGFHLFKEHLVHISCKSPSICVNKMNLWSQAALRTNGNRDAQNAGGGKLL